MLSMPITVDLLNTEQFKTICGEMKSCWARLELVHKMVDHWEHMITLEGVYSPEKVAVIRGCIACMRTALDRP